MAICSPMTSMAVRVRVVHGECVCVCVCVYVQVRYLFTHTINYYFIEPEVLFCNTTAIYSRNTAGIIAYKD